MPNITLNAMKEISKNKNTEVEFTYGETVIKINTKLSLNEKSTFIDRVVGSCFIGDDFQPEYVDLMTFVTLIQLCSNVNIPKTKADYLDLNTLYDWMVGTKLIDKIHQFGYEAEDISDERDLYNWFADLEQCISDKIEFKKQQVLSDKNNATLNELKDSVSELTSAFGFVLDNLNTTLEVVTKKIETANLEQLLGQLIPNQDIQMSTTEVTDEEIKAEISE